MVTTVTLGLVDLYREITTVSPPNPVCLVGIDGCGGSGQSTLARALEKVGPDVTVIEMDDFYRPSRERQSNASGDGGIGADFDWPRLRDQVIRPLSDGVPGCYQRYDWGLDDLAEWHDVSASGVVIIEGVYVTRKELRDYYDCRIWVEAPESVRLKRGLARDGETARQTWTEVWMPAEAQYIESHRPYQHADIRIVGNHPDIRDE